MTEKIVPFYCDECKIELDHGYACKACRRILCPTHYYGSRSRDERDGLCVTCAEKKAKEARPDSTKG